MAAEWRGTFADLAREDVLAFGDGYRTKQSELGRPGFPILRVAQIADGFIEMAGIEDYVREEFRSAIGPKLSQVNDVVLTTKGTFGRRAIVRSGAAGLVYSPQVCYFRVASRARLDPRYLYYWLGSDGFLAQAVGLTSQTDMAAYLSLRDLARVRVVIPGVAEQRRIAGILGALDDKIELNRRTSETLEGTAQALFKFWFLDSGSDASDQDGSLADAVDLQRNLVDPQLEPDTVFQHYSLPAYDAGRKAISEPGAGIRSSKLAVPWGSVLLSKLNPEIERVWFPDIRPDDRAICSTEFLVLRPRVNFGHAFVYEFLRSAPFRSTLTSLVTGTTGSHQRAHAEAILQVRLRLPGPSRAAQFERLVGPMLDRIAVARRESHTLVSLRDALLPRLLSGETSLSSPARRGRAHSPLPGSEHVEDHRARNRGGCFGRPRAPRPGAA